VGFRRSPDRIAAERNWQRFVERNADTIARAGLPPQATATIAAWDDLLMHGHLEEDRDGFRVEDLTAGQYAALVMLASSYFAAGYEFYPPTALHAEDQETLRSRFGSGRPI
jgi:hypothetical protein